MDKLRAMQFFVRVVDGGSFSAAAEALNVTTSMISKEIQRLETHLGVRLLHRSTRGQQLTELGEGYLLRCRDVLAQIDDAESFVQQLQVAPRGKLRINAPMALGITDLAEMFSGFMQQYPEIELDIQLSDESQDLIEHGFDLGFRAASAPFDSAYIGKALTRFKYVVCVAPEYLTSRIPIIQVADLAHHNCFIYSYFRGGQHWPLGEGIEVKGSLKVNNTLFMLKAIEAGLGIGFLPDFVARESLESGRVVEILPDEPRPALTLYALYPNRNQVPPKLLACIEFIRDWFLQNHSMDFD